MWYIKNGPISLETFQDIYKRLILSFQYLAFSTTLSNFDQVYRNWASIGFWIWVLVIKPKLLRKKIEKVIEKFLSNMKCSYGTRSPTQPIPRAQDFRLGRRRYFYKSKVVKKSKFFGKKIGILGNREKYPWALMRRTSSYTKFCPNRTMGKGWRIGRTQNSGEEERGKEKWREDTRSRCQIWLDCQDC